MMTGVCHGQTWTPVLAERDMPPAAGATVAEAVGEIAARAEDSFVPHRLLAERGIGRRAVNMTYRFFKLAAFDVPQEDWLRVANHEVFGHGGRLRELFDGPVFYSVPAPPPYGRGGGATFFSFDREPTFNELMAISAGGMEADTVAAERLALQSMSRGSMHVRDAIRYVLFQLDTIDYILRTGDGPEKPGHDVGDFLDIYNEVASLTGTSSLTPKMLRRRVLLSFANPLLAEAVYSIAIGYVWRGDLRTPLPTIRVGNARYLPLARFQLTPFGTEWTVDNLVLQGERTFDVAVRAGGGHGVRAWGTHLTAVRLTSWQRWELGGTIDVWRQPSLALDDKLSADVASWGTSAKIAVTRPLFTLRPFPVAASFMIEAGFKTRGHVAGERLDAGSVVRVGLGLGLP